MNILFVCTGNTCRSPMAAGYLQSRNLTGVNVSSRGLCADGSAVSVNSAAVMKEKGLDISKHISSQITAKDIEKADKIICMSPSHKAALANFADSDKLFILGGGIPDPYGMDITAYRNCRDMIFAAIDTLADSGFFNGFCIVPLKHEHLKQIAALEKLCFSTPWSEQAIAESFENGTKFFVAEQNGKVLGYIGIGCIIDEGYITNVAVFVQYRNMGVATALLKRTFELAKDIPLSFISLEVRESNISAISLYEKLGFCNEGRRKAFYTNPKEDALIMTKRFEEE